jgi:hypothetical protein
MLHVDGIIDYGLDYAFEFGATNPQYTPEPALNLWRYETLRNNVILHLRQNVIGFNLEQIEVVTVTHGDTTSLYWNRVTFNMMSNKAIEGGSTIKITAPIGFEFNCRFFRTDSGLSATTTCSVGNPTNKADFVIDSQDPKQPRTPFALFVNLRNPQFTPQVNEWSFNIVSPLQRSIDIRDRVPGFDITGKVNVEIQGSFNFNGETNPLRIKFEIDTILNMADPQNEIVVQAPSNYIFRSNCTGFRLRCFREADCTDPNPTTGYPLPFEFPPADVTCQGYDNNIVIVRLPTGTVMLILPYVLEVDVQNPLNYSVLNNQWSFLTRVVFPANYTSGGSLPFFRTVDANRTLSGFALSDLVPLDLDESSALQLFTPRLYVCSLLTFWIFVAFATGCAAD